MAEWLLLLLVGGGTLLAGLAVCTILVGFLVFSLIKWFGAQNQVANLKGEVESKGTEVEKLQEEVESKGTEVEKLQEEVESKGTEVDNLNREVKSKGTEVEKLQEEVEVQTALLLTANNKVLKLQNRSQKLVEEIGRSKFEKNNNKFFTGKGPKVTGGTSTNEKGEQKTVNLNPTGD